MKGKATPTSLTLKWWKTQHKAMADIVERHIRTRRRTIAKDLFKAFDVCVLCPIYKSVILLQVTSSKNHSTRRKKVLESEAFQFFRDNNIDVIVGVQSWRYRQSDKLWVSWCQMWDKDTQLDTPLEIRTTIDLAKEAPDAG